MYWEGTRSSFLNLTHVRLHRGDTQYCELKYDPQANSVVRRMGHAVPTTFLPSTATPAAAIAAAPNSAQEFLGFHMRQHLVIRADSSSLNEALVYIQQYPRNEDEEHYHQLCLIKEDGLHRSWDELFEIASRPFENGADKKKRDVDRDYPSVSQSLGQDVDRDYPSVSQPLENATAKRGRDVDQDCPSVSQPPPKKRKVASPKQNSSDCVQTKAQDSLIQTPKTKKKSCLRAPGAPSKKQRRRSKKVRFEL